MNKQFLALNWRSILGALAISLGTFGIMESPADASPNQVQDSFEVAQARGRGRIKAPTPLNLRPRNHFPLPASRHNRYNQRSDYYGHPGYRGSRRGHGQYRGSSRRGRYDHDHHDHHTHNQRNRRRRSSVIIINPSHSNSSYNNYDGYIRVIRK